VTLADDRSIRVRLLAEVQNYQQGLKTAARSTQEFGREVSGMGKASRADIEKVGRSALLMSAGMAVGLGLSVKAAIGWESAWAGVLKTVDGTADQLSELEGGLRDLAKELPASHAEIAGVAEAAGQLGIKVNDVEAFTKVMIDLGETTNLSADEAATSLARLANIMGTSSRDFDRLGSTIVELGNNSETTEAEIVEFAQRLAAAGNIAGLSESDVLAFAASMTSVGVGAEAGGTALSKTFTAIRDATLTGGEALETFASVAGVTADEFVAAFRDDPAMAIESFIAGLGRMNSAGQSTTSVFDELGLADERLMRALNSTAEAGDHLADRIAMGNAAWEENTALQEEAALRYGTTEAQLEILRNKFTDLGIDIGRVFLPALQGIADAAGNVATGLGSLPSPLKATAAGFAGVLTAGLGVIGTLGVMGPKVLDARDALDKMGKAGKFVNRNMGRMAVGVGVAGVALAGITYVAAQQAKKAAEADERVKSWADAIREAGDAAGGAIGFLSELVDETPTLALAMAEAGVSAIGMADALIEGGDAWQNMGARITAGGEAAGLSKFEIMGLLTALGRMAAEGAKAEEIAAAVDEALGAAGDGAADAASGSDIYSEALDKQAAAAEEVAEALADLIDSYSAPLEPFFAMQDALQAIEDAGRDAQEAQRDVADAQRAVGDAQRDAARKVADAQRDAVSAARDVDEAQRGVAEAMSMVADEAEAARRGISDLAADQRASVDPLFGMLDALQKQRELLAKKGDDKASPLDLAKGAADVTGAATRLAGAIQTGDVSVEESRRMLDAWVGQGLITAAQAADVAKQFAEAAARAEDLQGANVRGAAAAEVAAENLRVNEERAEAVASAQDRLREAMEKSAEAQERVAEAGVEGAEAVAEAQNNLAEAMEKSAEAERGAERRATDLMVASIALSGAMEGNAGLMNLVRGRIREMGEMMGWSKDRTDEIIGKLEEAAGIAGEYAQPWVATISLDARQFWQELANMRFALSMIQIEQQLDNPYSRPIGGAPLAAGGLVEPIYRARGGPSGTDTVPAWLTPGEFVMRKSAVDQIGASTLRYMNEGRFAPTSAATGGGMTTVVTNININAGSIVGSHRELITAVERGLTERGRVTAGVSGL